MNSDRGRILIPRYDFDEIASVFHSTLTETNARNNWKWKNPVHRQSALRVLWCCAGNRLLVGNAVDPDIGGELLRNVYETSDSIGLR